MKPLSLQKTFGATITRLRTERKMSVEALSAVTRIWTTRLKGIEAGTAIVTLPEIGRLSSALEIVFNIGRQDEAETLCGIPLKPLGPPDQQSGLFVLLPDNQTPCLPHNAS